MIQALNRYIAKKINAVIMMAPLKREMIRLAICFSIAALLNVVLFFGVEADGAIKPWAEIPLRLLASTTLFVFMVKIFLPIFGWTILKAVLLSANNAFGGILSFLGNQFTGALYCSALVLASLALKQYTIDGTMDPQLAILIPTVFLAGFLYFYFFQCAIQKTIAPALRTPPLPRSGSLS
ncbi:MULTISPECIES: hypothetical protein [Pseudomonas]|jgi:hypothetical protein|uniref:Uncharacterized protein n=1 Tax=Pseudomonas putida TaxID=303 RepID=A0A6I6XNF0_PSEPU|nr:MULTISPECIES: hypothetical protein [Pseudomonas]MBA6113521.1 hypothetical protein [Pseudomonas asiatica]QHG67161.1 hypothetical protein C2H86_23255 [Pseudomonas putida]